MSELLIGHYTILCACTVEYM